MTSVTFTDLKLVKSRALLFHDFKHFNNFTQLDCPEIDSAYAKMVENGIKMFLT